MGYTEIYRKIYAAAKKDSVPHEIAHSISITITDAITTLRSYVRENHPDLTETVEEIVSGVWKKNEQANSWVDFYEPSTWKRKIGGYDLDDHGRPLDGHD